MFCSVMVSTLLCLSYADDRIASILEWDLISTPLLSFAEIDKEVENRLKRGGIPDDIARELRVKRSMAVLFQEKPDPATANEELGVVLETAPDHLDANFVLARIWFSTPAERGKAVAWAIKTTKEHPSYANAHFLLGHYYLSANVYSTAIDCFTDAIKRNGAQSYFYYSRAVAYIEAGNPSAAIRDLDLAITLPPSTGGGTKEILILRGCALARSGKAVEAEANLRRGFAIQGAVDSSIEIRGTLSLCGVLTVQEKFSDAHVAAERAASKHPDSIICNVLYGTSLAQAGEYEKALEVIDRTISSLSPKSLSPFQVRAELYLRLGRWRDAAKDYDQIRNKPPIDADNGVRIALFLAACPDDRIRDVKFARFAVDGTLPLLKSPNARKIGFMVMAVAQAAESEFEQAVASLDQADRLGKPDDRFANARKELRQLFVARIPYRFTAEKDPSAFMIPPAFLFRNVADESSTQ